MIILTGAAGFIGSCVAQGLNAIGRDDLVLVDDFSVAAKDANHVGKGCIGRVDRAGLLEWMGPRAGEISGVVHLGARTDTAELDWNIFERLNLGYTKALWKFCSQHGIPFIYASSAATYGAGEQGFDDDHAIVPHLQPLNPYGRSKNDFDVWALGQAEQPPVWAGLKFFNVYGPNEYHKGRMASVIFHAYRQIQANGGLKLFRSHRADYADGEQRRDFIYVLLEGKAPSAIYNLGSGTARSFLDLGWGVFAAMGKTPEITFIDIPADIRDSYQYYTQANMDKLRAAGYERPFTSLETGISEYVNNFLIPMQYL